MLAVKGERGGTYFFVVFFLFNFRVSLLHFVLSLEDGLVKNASAG